MRRLFSFIGIASLLFAITPVATQAETCPVDVQMAYKSPASSAVYYVTETCTKRAFKHATTFFTYFENWDDVVSIPTATLNAITDDTLGFMPAGPRYEPQNGTLVKSVDDPKVYLIYNYKKWPFADEAGFLETGFEFSWIEDVDLRLIQNYPTGSTITANSGAPAGTFIKGNDTPAIYQLTPYEGVSDILTKKRVPSMEVFESFDYRIDRIPSFDTMIIDALSEVAWEENAYGELGKTFLETYADEWQSATYPQADLSFEYPFSFLVEDPPAGTPEDYFEETETWAVEIVKTELIENEDGVNTGEGDITVAIGIEENIDGETFQSISDSFSAFIDSDDQESDTLKTIEVSGTEWFFLQISSGEDPQPDWLYAYFTVSEDRIYSILFLYEPPNHDREVYDILINQGDDEIASFLLLETNEEKRDAYQLLDYDDQVIADAADSIVHEALGEEFNNFVERFLSGVSIDDEFNTSI